MSRPTFIAAGSNTLVKSGPGNIYGIHVTPANGTTVVVADSLNLGASPNLNSTSLTGQIASVGTFASAVPAFIDMKGAHFDNGLVIAATSNARLTVLTD